MQFAVFLCCSVQCLYVFLCSFAVFVPPLRPLLLALSQKLLMQTSYLVAKRIYLGGILVAIQQSYGPISLDDQFWSDTSVCRSCTWSRAIIGQRGIRRLGRWPGYPRGVVPPPPAFLELRYPKGLTGRLPLCPIMALDMMLYMSLRLGKSRWFPASGRGKTIIKLLFYVEA